MSTIEVTTERLTIVTRESFGLAAPRDMRGAKLALPPRSHANIHARALAVRAFTGALAVAGLTLDDARFVDVADELTALRRGDVDAVFVQGVAAVESAVATGAVVLVDLDPEVRALVVSEEREPRVLAPFEILDVLRALGRDAETYRRIAHHTRHERWFRRLSITDDYDVWLIGWYGRQGVDLHDHGGSSGALAESDAAIGASSPLDASMTLSGKLISRPAAA